MSAPRHRGQVLPAYLMAIVASLALTLAVIQVGSAHVLERRAETAADAAALAGAQRLGRELDVGSGGVGLGGGGAEGAAEELAESNDAELVEVDLDHPEALAWRVTATVETRDGVIDGPIDAVVGRQVRSTSTAELAVEVGDLPPSATGAPEAELARRAGVPYPLRVDSALVRYSGQTCRDGVDTDRLSDAVKVAVLAVEASVGRGLTLVSGYASEACLQRAGEALPGLSPATRGDQIELAPGQPQAGLLLAGRRFCRMGDAYIAPGSLACLGDLSSLVSVRTRLVPDP